MHPLSRRLLRFHQPGDVVDAQTMESFIKVLKSTLSYDFLKQIDLDDIVDTMKKFQEEHDNWNYPDLQASAGKSCNHHSRKIKGPFLQLQ